MFRPVNMYPNDFIALCDAEAEKKGTFNGLFKLREMKKGGNPDMVFLNPLFNHPQRGWAPLAILVENIACFGGTSEERENINSASVAYSTEATYIDNNGNEQHFGQAVKYIKESQEYLLEVAGEQDIIDPYILKSKKAKKLLATKQSYDKNTNEPKGEWITVKFRSAHKRSENIPHDQQKIKGQMYSFEESDFDNRQLVPWTYEGEVLKFGNIHHFACKGMIAVRGVVSFGTISVFGTTIVGRGEWTFLIRKEPEEQQISLDVFGDDIFGVLAEQQNSQAHQSNDVDANADEEPDFDNLVKGSENDSTTDMMNYEMDPDGDY